MNGRVEPTKVFDTYEKSNGFGEFVESDIPDGHIVVAACKDECSTGLSVNGKLWFTKMGSKEIWKVKYRCGFAFIGIIGQKTCTEKRSEGTRDQVSVSYAFEIGKEIFKNADKEDAEAAARAKAMREARSKKESPIDKDGNLTKAVKASIKDAISESINKVINETRAK